MRGVSKRLGRAASLLAVLTILVAPAVFAADGDECDGAGQFFERAKSFIVIVFSRIGGPPG
jgi:hypothetical protein